MLKLTPWLGVLLGLVLTIGVALLVVWWRQQARRWAMVLAVCLAAALLLSWWSALAFQVANYRAGCDGVCLGFRGAPFPVFANQMAGETFAPAGFLLNTLIYAVILLAWSAIIRAVVYAINAAGPRQWWRGLVAGLVLAVIPFAVSPWFLPPPEAHVRGDSQRVAINARREVFMYDAQASWPVLRVGLDDVRPRPDGAPGLRVCLRTYTFFYMPTGALYLDMTPQGVHSNNGGFLVEPTMCWE